MIKITEFEIRTLPMITHSELQRVDIAYQSQEAAHFLLSVYNQGEPVISNIPVTLNSGTGKVSLMLPVQQETFRAIWIVTDQKGNVCAQTEAVWEKPRELTMYAMVSSHTDIGLHNSQYIQRYNSCLFLDKAKKLCDETSDEDELNQYRYTIEGTWFLNNYGMDREQQQVDELAEDYIAAGKIGVCCGVAGNLIQTYGLEEMCRSTYEKKRLKDAWNVQSSTMTMIDNNGMPMSMIQPYVEAGYKNIIFAPNQWNPLASTIWETDVTKVGYEWNPDASGGGARIDVRYDSSLPFVFYWEDKNGNRILVWASTQYKYGGSRFGLFPHIKYTKETIPLVEYHMSRNLPDLMRKYPYDTWLFACYCDDQEPDHELLRTIQAWNAKWKYPQIRMLGNPDEPFRILREKYGEQIPVLKGDIIGGWYQIPMTTPELFAAKLQADRMLPTAEKWSTVAAILDDAYEYPTTEFRRAWDYLLYNDEHSYGVSGYQGRRVYETWMQHRDWIEKAQTIANKENNRALDAILSKIHAEEQGVVVFNPTALDRKELIFSDDKKRYAIVDVPSFGYTTVNEADFLERQIVAGQQMTPPIIENKYYKIVFAENGSMLSVHDKELNKELLKKEYQYHANELLYSNDNHKTFHVPDEATFFVQQEAEKVTVEIHTNVKCLGAEIVQTVTLLNYEKRIDIDNRLYHVKDMINKNRYYRYIYFAFPFDVEECRRYCHLNGTTAEYAKDVTGHGTDVYMATHEWCCAENAEYGVALMMLDSQLVEFDHIHPEKTDFGNAGNGSQMFVYAANDWLQMHTPGGSHLDYQFRYSITSYNGTHQNAHIAKIAERYANPVQVANIPKQEGVLPKGDFSFIRIPDEKQRLICVKRADDGDGIIVRLYGKGNAEVVETNFGENLAMQRVRIDETDYDGEECVGQSENRFSTYRIGHGAIKLAEKSIDVVAKKDGVPEPIGSVYTGLITEPRAGAGEHAGHLYLLWGQNIEDDFSHYKLYRSEEEIFEANDATFVADIFPEEYRVGRYEDIGLKEHTCYYYKVCAVNKSGKQGEFSKVFKGITRESLEREE